MLSLKLPAAISRPVAYALGLFATKGLALIMLPILANHLSVEQIGQLELYTSSGVFFAMILSLALHEALYRFAGHEACSDIQTKVAGEIYTLACMVAGISLTGLLLLITLATTLFPLLPVQAMLLLSLGVASEGLIGLQLAWLRMQDRAGQFLQVTVCICLLQVSLVALSLWLIPGVLSILAASVITHFIQFIWLQRLCRLPMQRPCIKRAREFVAYSLPIALAGLVAFTLNGAERWVIAATDTIESLAYYAIAAKFALALCILVQPFGMWWMPKRFAVLLNQGCGEATRITQYGIIWVALLCSAMAYFAPLFIQLTLPANYHSAGQMVLLCLLAALFKELTELVNLGLLASKQTGKLLRFNLIAAGSGALLIMTMLSWGVWGIITGLVLAQLTKLTLVYRASQIAMALPYALRRLTLVIVTAVTHLLISVHLSSWQLQLMMSLLAPLSVILVALLAGLLPLPYWLRKNRIATVERL